MSSPSTFWSQSHIFSKPPKNEKTTMKIKNLISFTFLFCLVGLAVQSSSAQFSNNNAVRCAGDYVTPIKCGYHQEGYQDGMNDARANRDYDYKRYKDKYGNRYESFYRAGYDRGYRSINPNVRWTNKQKDAYEDGYDDGDKDKDRGISRLPARYEGQYDRAYEAYYQKGYYDGYDRRPKQYDVAVGTTARGIGGFGNNDRFPNRNRNRRGTTTGSLTWNGRVDGRTNLVLRGSTVRVDAVTGRNLGDGRSQWVGVLPRRQARVVARRLDGRGSVVITQQPTRANRYTTIVSINDTRRGSDNYRIQISWQSTNVQEPYSRGKVTWRGRVDQTGQITISGDDVSSFAISGRSLTNVSFDIDGYLARRRGTVSVRKRDGRGTVTVLEQPSRQNDYVAIIQIFDPKRSDDNYEIEITW